MPFLEWNDAYSVGVTDIDIQHQRIFKLINELYDAIAAGSDREMLERLINDLHAYADFHFNVEETRFREFHYEHETEHDAMHQAYRVKVAEFEERYRKGNAPSTAEVFDFMHDWWISHINRADKAYGPLFNEHGLY